MKNTILHLFFFLFFISFSNAQDTVVVQTLTWADDFRAGVFEFPDNPTGDWEKILMMYNMRCHDNAVGNGGVGCREWDYSCNTFITDSSIVDSTRLLHLTHIISNFDNQVGNTFRYVDQPVYSYYQYNQHQTNYINTVSETDAKVGADELPLPMAGNTEVGKGQFLYTAAELQSAGLTAGDITGLKLDIVTPGDDVNFLRIRIKATNESSMDASNPDLDGFEEVYFSSTAFANTGTNFFRFYNNFEWDGMSNLIMEFSYTTPPVATAPSIYGHQTANQSGLVYLGGNDNALNFAGVGSVRTPDFSLSEISDEITIALWTKGNEAALPVNTYAFEGVDGDNNRQASTHLPWSNGQIYWDCGYGSGSYDRINKQATESEYEGAWTHWTFTKNAPTGSMKIFKNGTLWHQGTAKNKPMDIEKFFIGSSSRGITNYQGLIDGVQIFNKELDETAIKAWMYQPYDSSLPFAANLQSYYSFDEGSGRTTTDISPNANVANIESTPVWTKVRGRDLFKSFVTSTIRPTATFVQGEYTLDDQVILVLDSIENAPNMVISYGLDGTDLMSIDTQFFWDADASLIYDEDGSLIDFNDLMPTGSVTLDQFAYYQKRPGKFEILSLVTPYGNGLNLGPEGKTFKIDVTDYAPILKGKKRMSLEMGGQNQEEMDIKFLFIKGTPTREVRNIQNVWPFRRGNIGQILDDTYFEPRMVSTPIDASIYKLRVAVTGHGQNGEFQPRNHFVKAGSQQYDFDVWKECSEMPIYPQGGTWLFDRAGWCPGLPTDVHEFDITQHIAQGNGVEIDYGINGVTMDAANYLVSAQLVTYGEPSFRVDAEVVEVIRPTTQLEHARKNPACNEPTVRIKNNGNDDLKSLTIEYGEKDGQKKTYNWTGNLEFLQTEDIALPIDFIGFWTALEGSGIFEVSISNVNGGLDEYANNNHFSTSFERPKFFERPLQVQVRTNNNGGETSYTVKDINGNEILRREGLAANTTYIDQLQLPRGCYTFEVNDSEDDGLYYWYWEQVGPPRGRGSARLMQLYPNGIVLPGHSFEAEFGRSAQIDFAIPAFVNTLEQGELEFFSLYPNPASETINLDLKGFEGDQFQIDIIDVNGKIIKTQKVEILSKDHLESVDISTFPSGMYFAKVKNSEQFWVREFVKK